MIAAALTMAVLADASSWKAIASEQVEAAIHRDPDGSVCLDYDFGNVSGYAVMRRPMPVRWPRAFALRVRIKGRGGLNDFQLKLVDAFAAGYLPARRASRLDPVIALRTG